VVSLEPGSVRGGLCSQDRFGPLVANAAEEEV
jgi:hypothetical protein